MIDSCQKGSKMASVPLGDIIGARFPLPHFATHASVASNGANAKIAQIGPFPHNIRIRTAQWTPTGADNAATEAASYRRLTLCNGGTTGTSTSIIASLNMTASAASLAPVSMTVDTTNTLAAGQVLVASQETVGAAHATGTVLAAGQFALGYEVI